MKSFCLLSLVLILLPGVSPGLDDSTSDYLAGLEQRKASVFVVQCSKTVAPGKGYKTYNAALFIEVGSTKGLLVETRDDSTVNLADFDLTPAGPRLVETHGGIYSYDRVGRLIKDLVKQDFQFLSPFRLADYKALKVNLGCPAAAEE